MSYSARQLHCLEAMGLVAWTCRESSPGADKHAGETSPAAYSELPVAYSDVEESSVAATSKAVTVNTDAGMAAQPSVSSEDEAGMRPDDIADLAQWLVGQTVAQFSHRGVKVNIVGPEQASLLVICQHDSQLHDESSQLPLNSECAQLFELMMRSINMSRNSVRQCVIINDHHAQSSGDALGQDVNSLCTAHTKALLVLDSAFVASSTDADDDHCLLPLSSLPLWRVPHPQLLMQTPALKRRAWEALKQLQNVLAA